MYKRNVLGLIWSFFSNYVMMIKFVQIYVMPFTLLLYLQDVLNMHFFYLDQVHFDSLNIIIIIVYIFYHIGYFFTAVAIGIKGILFNLKIEPVRA